jgi:hypothetical protein
MAVYRKLKTFLGQLRISPPLSKLKLNIQLPLMKKRTTIMILVGMLSLAVMTLVGWGLVSGSFPGLAPSPSPTAVEAWALADVPEDWVAITPGLELRQVTIQEAPTLLVRADLDLLALDLRYDTTDPQTVADWQKSTGALMVVNAGFFEPDYTTSGIMVIQDEIYGESYTQRDNAGNLQSGMFVLEGGQANIHRLDSAPISISDDIYIGLESFPLLFLDSTTSDFRLPERTARRTVIALDKQGRLVFVLHYDEGITLYKLQDELFALSEELGLVSALNLDGGLSTGISISAGGIYLATDSTVEVSSVFTLSPLN